MVRKFALDTQFTNANLATAADDTSNSQLLLELARAQADAAAGVIEAQRIAQEALDADTAAQKIAANKLAKEAADRAAALQKIANDKKIEADRLAAEAVAKAGTAADAATTAATSSAKGAAAAATLAAKQGELKTLQDKQAADWAYQQKLIADKAAADKVAAEKAAADKAAADKAAADKAAADKLAQLQADLKKAQDDALASKTAAETAAAQARIDAANAALETAAKLAAQKANYDKFVSDQVAASNKTLLEQTAASKLAYDTAAAEKAQTLMVERTSAFTTLKTQFEKYGLGSLADTIKNLVLNGTSIADATLKLRDTPAYQLRFAGNTIRLKEGKNLYDEGTYLGLENDFAESFAAYGQNALLGPTRESAQAKFAEYIGMDKSPVEIKNRIKLAVDEVKGRPEILKTFNEYFPSLDENDLVSYFLDPKDTLSRLQTKVQTAQIGTAASRQGLQSSSANSLELAQFGLTEEQANVGYQKVARDLPTIEKLGSIDNVNINQTTTENAYLKGLASEQRKIDQAAERERNRFSSSTGNAPGSYSTGYLKKSSAAGQI